MNTPYVRLVRLERNGTPCDDSVAVEEPLEVRIADRPWIVTMRTPGHDEELAAGMLWSERVVRHPGDIVDIRHCTAQDADSTGNVVMATLNVDATTRAIEQQRKRPAYASCGVCGKQSIGELAQAQSPLQDAKPVHNTTVLALPALLNRSQAAFARTGGLHGAGLFTTDGKCLCVREDVGRHNAVDKAIGWAVLERSAEPAAAILMVLGHVSFEIVAKAWTLGVPVVAAISAPTSLAISLADRAGITLIGFVRERSLNVYSHTQRVIRECPTG